MLKGSNSKKDLKLVTGNVILNRTLWQEDYFELRAIEMLIQKGGGLSFSPTYPHHMLKVGHKSVKMSSPLSPRKDTNH